MPIKGLTDRQNQFGAGLPRIATLYKGDEKQTRTDKNGKSYEVVGKDLKHFRVEFEPQFKALQPVWEDLYGKDAAEFQPVYVAYQTTDEAFSAWNEEWTATAMMHRCDGEYQQRHFNKESGIYSSAKIPCIMSESGKSCGCKPTGRLNLLFPDFIEAAGILGFVTITTHSLNDILLLTNFLRDTERMVGQLTGIPFVFGRADKQVSAPKPNGKPGERLKVTKSLLYLHHAPEFTQRQLIPALTAQPVIAPLPALPDGVTEGVTVDMETGEVMEQPRIPETDKVRQSMGSGGSRRVGKESKKPAKPADHWTHDAEQVKQVITWAETRLSMNEAMVVTALQFMHFDLKAVADWTSDLNGALATIIAWKADYNVEMIEMLTANPGILKSENAVTIFDLAVNVAEQHATFNSA